MRMGGTEKGHEEVNLGMARSMVGPKGGDIAKRRSSGSKGQNIRGRKMRTITHPYNVPLSLRAEEMEELA